MSFRECSTCGHPLEADSVTCAACGASQLDSDWTDSDDDDPWDEVNAEVESFLKERQQLADWTPPKTEDDGTSSCWQCGGIVKVGVLRCPHCRVKDPAPYTVVDLAADTHTNFGWPGCVVLLLLALAAAVWAANQLSSTRSLLPQLLRW